MVCASAMSLTAQKNLKTEHLVSPLGIDNNAGAVGGGDVGAALILNDSGLESVERHLGSLLTGEAGGGDDAQVIKQTILVGVTGNSDGVVAAGVALDLSLVAERAEQHLALAAVKAVDRAVAYENGGNLAVFEPIKSRAVKAR